MTQPTTTNQTPTYVYNVRNIEQGYTLHAFSKEQDAQKYYIEKRVKPYFQEHGTETASDYCITCDPYNPKTEADWQSLFDCFEDVIIEKVELD